MSRIEKMLRIEGDRRRGTLKVEAVASSEILVPIYTASHLIRQYSSVSDRRLEKAA
jgi:hypothetical protein